MATYSMTPEERRARAQAIIYQREYVAQAKRNAKLSEAYSYNQAVETAEKKEKENQNWFIRGLSTIGDVVANVLEGAVKGLEGIYDLGAGIVGAVGGIFSDDFRDSVQDHIAYDFAGEVVGEPLQEALRYSYLKEDGIVENVASGIGQMLPAVIATIATYGAYAGVGAATTAASAASTAAQAAQAASLITMGVSAAGTATEEAFQEGADYYAGLGYGVASGLVEVGTEKMFGGATKALTGAGIFDGVLESTAKTGIRRIALNAVEEGAEEVASELANPALKSIYKGSDAFSQYGDWDYWKGVGKAGVVGSLTALGYSGTVGYGMSKIKTKNGQRLNYVGKEADVQEVLGSLENLKVQEKNLQESGTGLTEKKVKIAETTRKGYQQIETILKNATEKKRASIIKEFSLDKAFNSDGSLSAEMATKLGVGELTEQSSNGETTPLASDVNDYNYSTSLWGREAEIESDLGTAIDELARTYIEDMSEKGETVTIEEAREKVGRLTIKKEGLEGVAMERRNKFNKALNVLDKMSGTETSFVVVDSSELASEEEGYSFGAFRKGDKIYIDSKEFENDTWAEDLVHEVTHLEEGSQEYEEMVAFLQSDDITVDDGNGGKIKLWEKAQNEVFSKRYGLSPKQIETIFDKVNAGESLTEQEAKMYKKFRSELVAHETGVLLGNESFIDRIISKDSSMAKRIIDKIINLKKMFKKVDVSRAEYKQLVEAEKLYLKAARRIGDVKLAKYILAHDRYLEEEEIVASDSAENASVTNEAAVENGEHIVSDSDGIVQFNLNTYNQGGREVLEKNLIAKGFNTSDVESALATIDELASFMEELGTTYKDLADWNNAKVYYDDEGHAIYSAMVSNGDYPLNIDLSKYGLTRGDTESDTQFNLRLPEDPTAKPYFYELTDGQVKKLLANYTRRKVYNKVEAEEIITTVVGSYLSFGDTYGTISGKSKAEVIDMLWRGLNTAVPGKQAKVALDVAEYIIQHSIVESIYDDPSYEVYTDTIALLKPYLHKINLDGIKGEIKYRYDKDNSPYLLWGKRKGDTGKSADVIAMELESLGFHIDAINEADIFFQIDEAYRTAVAGLKKDAKAILSESLNAEERKQLKQDLAKEILRSFDSHGKSSKLSEFLGEYAKKAQFWREKYYEERNKNKVLNRVLDKIQRIKDIKLGTFINASQYKTDIFKGSIEQLSRIKYRGNLNESGTRDIIKGLSEWYNEENPMLAGQFDEDIAVALKEFANGEGKLTTDDLKALENIVDYFKHFIETYNKVYRNGQYVEAEPIAKKYVEIIHTNEKTKVGWLRKFFEKYLTTFGDPMTVVRYMDRYSDGFYTEMLESLRKGAIGAGVMEMEMREPIEAFYKKNKKFLESLKNKTVTYQGTEIPLSQAMLLYMSLNRDQAILGLAKSGFAYTTEDGKVVRINGFAVEEDLEIEEIRVRAKEVQKGLASQFTEAEKEYIAIAERLFNEDCKEAKKKTDMQLRGYTNALEDYYVPIRRYVVGQSVDTESYLDEMARVSNASFNKDTVKGARNELYLGTLESVLDRHIRAVSLYANLAMPLREYDVLYNLDTAGNPNKPTSVKTEGVNAWAEGQEYFQKLVKDIQGIPASKSVINKWLSKLRGGYAKYQLGANPKVWVTQLSSFAAAGNILDVGSIVRGLGIKASDVDEHCSLAKLRNNENTAALSQGVMEKTGKIGDVLMKPIGMVDRLVIKKLFGACQVQVEKDGGAKIGTKENKTKAGELLERVILETQQNAIATERSSAMRDGSEIMKTLTMFSADSMKVIGRVVDSIGEVAVLKTKRKNATNPAEIASLDKKIKTATKKAGRSIASLISTAVFMALIAQAFRTLYNKDDEDENIIQNMTVDAVGNLFGGLPLIRDIYSFYAEGYDLDNYAYSTVNDLLKSGQDIFDLIGSLIDGSTDSRDVATSIKKAAYAGGQLLGIPTRNIYNFVYGLTKRFSPSTAYKIDDVFYKQSYRSDLAKAIENEDEAMIATIAELMLDENLGGLTDSKARKELATLIEKGFDVIPRSVQDTITYDGEEYTLSSAEKKDFEKVYSTANEAVASLVKLPQYDNATDEVKAKAVNFIYTVYYNLALQDFLGVDLENKNILFAEAIDIEKLALIVATARTIVGDTDKTGKVVSGSRKRKVQAYINSLNLKAVQKYMVMGYLGYSNQYGENQVKAYINRLSLTKAEKEKLLAYSGYAS